MKSPRPKEGFIPNQRHKPKELILETKKIEQIEVNFRTSIEQVHIKDHEIIMCIKKANSKLNIKMAKILKFLVSAF